MTRSPKPVLLPCLGCARHVRVSPAIQGECPFCAAPLPPMPPPRRRAPSGLSRAAIIAFGSATLAPGCYMQHELEPGIARDAAPALVDAARADAFFEDASAMDSGEPVAPPYGIPPDFDGGEDDEDAGAVLNLYGAPPPPEPDAAVDSGTINAAYGAPAFDPTLDTDAGPSRD